MGRIREGVIDRDLKLYQRQSGQVMSASDTYIPTSYEAFDASLSDLKVGIEGLLNANLKWYIAYRNRRGKAAEQEWNGHTTSLYNLIG